MARAGDDDSWIDWGGTGPYLHLAHGNGFPPATYRELAEALTVRYHVVSAAARPLWHPGPPHELGDWHTLTADLRHQLGQHGVRGAVGIGHSLGSVMTLLAADADPGLFSAVVLIDPVLLSGFGSVAWRVMKALGLRSLLPIARGARRRRDHWSSRSVVRAAWAAHPVFASWDEQVLDDYLDAGLVEAEDGTVRLRYAKEWEARVFETAPHDAWPELARLRGRVGMVQGERTDPFLRPAAARARRLLGADRVRVIPGTTHFLPMEMPREVAQAVIELLGDPG
jgi:pimeloyl-ACP methyl ester carboxylesterase